MRKLASGTPEDFQWKMCPAPTPNTGESCHVLTAILVWPARSFQLGSLVEMAEERHRRREPVSDAAEVRASVLGDQEPGSDQRDDADDDCQRSAVPRQQDCAIGAARRMTDERVAVPMDERNTAHATSAQIRRGRPTVRIDRADA